MPHWERPSQSRVWVRHRISTRAATKPTRAPTRPRRVMGYLGLRQAPRAPASALCRLPLLADRAALLNLLDVLRCRRNLAGSAIHVHGNAANLGGGLEGPRRQRLD